MEKIYLLKGLDCPNCAAKIESEVGALSGISACTVNLMKQTLTVEAQSDLDEMIKSIVHTHEPDVEVTEYKSAVEDKKNDDVKMTARLIIGAIIFAAGIVVPAVYVKLPLLIAAYLILGGDVVLKAIKNIIKGRVFDENFLMSLSTVGAFAIGEYPEAVAVMLFYQVGEYFQELAVRRSRRSITELMDIRPDSAAVVRHGETVVLPPQEVKVGEVIVVRPGEKIPLDGVVINGESVLDAKALTGESLPQKVGAGDEVLSGCINQNGVLNIEVKKTYGESTVARIIDLVENASARKAPTENFITAFARYYTPVVVILAALLAFVPPVVTGGEFIEWIHRGLVFLVISCPCALVISIPLTFFGGIGAASKHGVLVKGSNYLEALNSIGTVVFDKTGTLTKGVFNVRDIFPANGFSSDELMKAAAHAESFSNHPIARSVIAAYGSEPDRNAVSDYKEITGLGISAIVCGKRILAGSGKLMEQESISYELCDMNGTKVYVAVDGAFAGCIVIADEIKQDSKRAIAELRRVGVERTVMLTGDDESIGREVSHELGIDEYYAQLLPDGKVKMLERLDAAKRSGSKLAFVGDGINDAPVLARADIGIAMGGLGSDAAIEVADVVLMTDEPSKLVEAINVAKATKRIVVQNIIIALGVKALFLLLGAMGVAGMWEAVFGDVGVALIAVLNAMRIMRK